VSGASRFTLAGVPLTVSNPPSAFTGVPALVFHGVGTA
jgi:hypothetical protein